jgi:hypothetical protein
MQQWVSGHSPDGELVYLNLEHATTIEARNGNNITDVRFASNHVISVLGAIDTLMSGCFPAPTAAIAHEFPGGAVMLVNLAQARTIRRSLDQVASQISAKTVVRYSADETVTVLQVPEQLLGLQADDRILSRTHA